MNNSFRSLLLITALLASCAARAVTFTSDTTVDFGNTNYDGNEVVISNCVLTVNGPHAFASLQVLSGGTLRHGGSDTGLFYSQVQTNEPLVLVGTNGVALGMTNVNPGSESVTDLAGTTVYTNGVDYFLLFDGLGGAALQRTDTSTIPDGATVSVTYTATLFLGTSGLNLTVAGDALIETGGAIALNGLGYNHGYGPGLGGIAGLGGNAASGGGGGHGGRGGLGATGGVGGVAFDSLLQPVDKGGSGGNTYVGSGAAGGGAAQLVVGGLLRVNGTLSANGVSATTERAGGGAGGSFWLTAQTLTGSGTITVDGGDGESPAGGGGAGGRIALYAQTNSFAGVVSAKGGRGAQAGGAGTIYTRIGQAVGRALVDNGGRSGASTPLSLTEPVALTVSGGAVVAPAAVLTVGDLVLAANGWLSVSNSLVLVTNNATIPAGCGITADGTGNPGGRGLGAGSSVQFSGYTLGNGAGYGGAGVLVWSNSIGGNCYGNISQPTDLGSGGGNGTGTAPYNVGGPGGGAIRLVVNGTLALDGKISANGGAGVGQASGGGSGGSISLTVGGLTGAGTLTANGGAGNDIGGSGGGGRIALYYQNWNFAGALNASGAGSGTNVGGAGTIYTRVTGQSAGQLLVDNGGRLASGLSTFSITEPLALTVQNGAVVSLGSGQALSSLTINSNGWLRLTNLVVTISGNATVQAGGGIVADGTGYAPGSGPGAGRSLSLPGGGNYYGGGGGYGGLGGFGGYPNGGTTYDTVSGPTQMGSGGGYYYGSLYGGAGGGSVRMNVVGTLTLNGRVSANGTDASGVNGGGGSGGCVALSVGTLAGSGLISANGGAGNNAGGGGGGGRIAITYSSSSFSGSMRAWGGVGGANGGAGTIFSVATYQSVPQLVLDNAGVPGPSSDITGVGMVDLILRGNAIITNAYSYPTLNNLTIGSNCWLVFGPQSAQSLTVNGNAIIQAGGGIKVDGAGYAAMAGTGAGRSYSGSLLSGSGGAYGGYGGAAYGGTGGAAYGTATTSLMVGSGGGNGTTGAGSGGAGGGALTLRVTGFLLVDGRISADGNPGAAGYNGGGGSGGSLYITAGALMGTGTLSASGGAGDGLGGGGGGGRIVVVPTVNVFAGSIVAYGGNGYARGGAGTVYIQSPEGPGQLVVDNGGLPGTNTLVTESGNFDLAVRGAGLLMPSSGNLSLRNLSIGSNSWLVFLPTQTASYINLNVSGNADIGLGGGIKADGAGYAAGIGPGAGRYSAQLGGPGAGGAGYGGAGGMASVGGGLGGASYGSATASPQPGSGGGTATYAVGGAGGACITLRVAGTLSLDGRISANGTSALSAGGGGGSGGSIYITTAALFGSGLISANGGNGISTGGGGGGGRVMLLPGANSFVGIMTAFGGDGSARGGAGTVYTWVTNQSTASLLVDNGGVPGTNTVLGESGIFDLTVRGGAKGAITSGSFMMRDLYVGANSWLIPPASPTTLFINGSGVLEAGGGIMAEGLGYASGSGPGAGSLYGITRGGGSYGGWGGANYQGGNTYGSAQQPSQLGSGGAYAGPSSPGPYNSAGGGAVMLSVAGTLDVEGKISANGNPGAPSAGGGSGGTVSLSVGTLLGSGSISANGGNSSGMGGGGGGGRIAISYGGGYLFSGSTTAYGGTSPVGNGGAGTVYLAPRSSTGGAPQLIVDNGGTSGTNTSMGSVSSSTDVLIRSGGIAWASGSTYLHNLTVQSNGWLRFGSPNTPLTVYGNANIQAGGGVIADGTGYPAGQGPGAGASLFLALGKAGTGGGHGGTGGSGATGFSGGATYDSPLVPNLAGSGGGGSQSPALGGAGGGVVTLTVSGTLQLDGRISANGAPGLAPGGGGGAGGTLTLSANTLTGSGTISANGGAGDGLGSGGGGGRIVVRYNTKSFTGLLSAFGGAGAATGGAGTLYTTALNQPSGLLLADNGGQSGADTPLPMLGTVDLTIQNGAIVTAASPFVCWSNLLINAGGTLTGPASHSNLQLMLLGNGRIESGGALSLDGKGYAQFEGPGTGATEVYIGSGAGYGGIGGASSASPGGAAYGSAQQPVDAGSGGGLGWGNSGIGSEGGGALRLTVAGKLTVNGRLSANGNAAMQDDAGGGSGGSLWIETAALAGNGVIGADGGAGELFGGGGGAGGRVAVYAANNGFAGQFSAAGASGYAWGQDGSLYFGSGVTPLAVAGQSPTGTVSNSVTTVDLYFSAPLNLAACLNNTDSTLTDPSGVQYQMLAYAMPEATHLQLSFAEQTVPGTYTFTVGSGIVDVFGQPMSQVYTGSFAISVPVIQGFVTDLNGQPIPGVVLQSSTGFATATTDTNGNYVLSAAPGSGVTVTPAAGSLAFVPGALVFTNLTGSVSNQNFLAVNTLVPTLNSQCSTSNLTLSWFGIPGVSYQPQWSTNLADWYSYGDPVLGTNGPVELLLPTDADPMKFFRLRAMN